MSRLNRSNIDFQVHADGGVEANADCAVDTSLRDLALGFLAENLSRVEFVWTRGKTPMAVCIERTRRFGCDVAHVSVSLCAAMPYGVTLRELDVLALMIAGLANSQISTALNLSVRTVTTHVGHLMQKFGASNRATVATMALDSGLIALPFAVDVEGLERLTVGRMVRSAGVRRERRSTRSTLPRAEVPVRVGALIPSVGRGRADAVEMLNGAQQAIEEVNNRGGIHGRPLLMEVADVDVDDPVGTRARLATLLKTHPSAITSGYLAGQPDAMRLAATDGVPFLHSSASCMLGQIVSAHTALYRNTFQFSPNDEDYAPAYVSFLNLLRASGSWDPPTNRIAVVVQSRWEMIDLGIDKACRDAADTGWELVTITADERTGEPAAWPRAARTARHADMSAVMIGSYFPEDHVQFIGEYLEAPGEALIYSAYAPSVPGFGATLGSDVEGLLWSTTTGTYSDELGSSFAQRYRNRFGALPGRSHAGIAYDKIHILANAWRQVDDVRDFDQVGTFLAETRYRGVNGAYSFDQREHRTFSLGHTSPDPSLAQAHTIFQIQSGRDSLLSPTLYAVAGFRAPPWTTAGKIGL